VTANRKLMAALAAIGCAAALVACGSDDEGSTASQTASTAATGSSSNPATTASTPATTVTTPAKKPKPKPVPPLPPGGKNVVVPDVTGQTLTEAVTNLAKAKLIMDAEAKSGNRADIQASWVVCSTSPAAGRRTASGTPVAVISAAPGQC
jgi:PASTA domain-containing protein